LAPLDDGQCRDLLEIMNDRHINRSTLITSQLPVENWHEMIGDDTLADAILDRLVHNAHKIKMKGESMRKRRAATKDLLTEIRT
jgi:DNA replication protein DnaC